MSDTKNLHETFVFHGVSLPKSSGQEKIGDCPFCDKHSHFFVNTKTGQYECKSCGDKGNHYSFLQKMHANLLKVTDVSDYKQLSHARSNLPWSTFKQARFAYDAESDRWLLPITNGNGKIADIRVWGTFGGDSKKLISTKNCSTHLYNGHTLKDNGNGTIYVCEGEWDAMALQWLFLKLELPQSSYRIVGVPGANTFKEDWLLNFIGKNVVLLYDNDTPGQAGMERAIKLLLADKRKSPKTLKKLIWPSDADLFPEKYDIRDFITDRLKTPKKAWRELQEMFKPALTEKPKRKLNRTTIESVFRDFSKAGLHLTKNSKDAFIVTAATSLSVAIPGDSVWLFLVGPPGSGKTLFINSFAKCLDHTEFISKVTAQALVSGFKTSDGSDPSLLAHIDNKCLFIKDYTAIKSMPLSVQEELYGILRDCYDKHLRVTYGNGEVREYKDLNFSLVAGVTDVIQGDNRATLGERFLKFELISDDYDPEEHIRSAISNAIDLVQGEELIQDSVESFYQHKLDSINLEKLPSVPQWVVDRVTAITQIAAFLRATVHRTQGDLLYRPRPEVGSRIGKQLIKIGRSIAIILGKKTIDAEVYALMEKLAFDSVVGWSLEFIRFLVDFLASNPNGASSSDISMTLQVSPAFVSRKLNDLRELRIIEKVSVLNGKKGHPTYLWILNPKFQTLWDNAKISLIASPKPRKKLKRKGVKFAIPRRKVARSK